MSQPQPEARSREARLPRHLITSPSVGHDSFPLTCPRCGWPCRHVWPVYWDSPWNALGGMCGQCMQEAAERFDVVGWPEERAAGAGLGGGGD